MLKALIITQNEPFFIPRMIESVISNSDGHYNIVACTILRPHRKNKSYLHWFKERFTIYSGLELILVGFIFFLAKLNNYLNSKSSNHCIKKVISRHGVTELKADDINSAGYLNKLSTLDLDVIISISCPQLFNDKLLTLPKHYCINAHGTLLPRHKGVFGSWWTLFSGDKTAGSTIHTMELKLDAGEILWQSEFPVEESDTQYSIAYKTKRDMALGLVQTLKAISRGTIDKIPPKFDPSYHKAPTKSQGKEFHKKGLRIIKFKDLKLVLAKTF